MIISDLLQRNRCLKMLSLELKQSFPNCRLSFLKKVVKNLGFRAGIDWQFWTFTRLVSKVKGFFLGARNSLFDGIGMYRIVGLKMFEY